MDPKRKKIYFIILGACAVLLIGVMIWSRSGTPEASDLSVTTTPLTPTPPVRSAVDEPEINTDGVYPAPAVFPQVRGFDSSVLNDLKLKKSFEALKLEEGELGRTNPLGTY